MKKELLLAFSLLFAVSCKNVDNYIAIDATDRNALFSIESITSRLVYPGVNDAKNSHKQSWRISLHSNKSQHGNASLLLKGFEIPIGKFGSLGPELGSDAFSYSLECDVKFPLSIHYQKNTIIEGNNDSLLILQVDDVKYGLKLKDIEVLKPIYYPSAN